MLQLALIALVVSLIAGALGFTDVARGAAKISKVLFAVFLILALLFLLLFFLGISLVT